MVLWAAPDPRTWICLFLHLILFLSCRQGLGGRGLGGGWGAGVHVRRRVSTPPAMSTKIEKKGLETGYPFRECLYHVVVEISVAREALPRGDAPVRGRTYTGLGAFVVIIHRGVSLPASSKRTPLHSRGMTSVVKPTSHADFLECPVLLPLSCRSPRIYLRSRARSYVPSRSSMYPTWQPSPQGPFQI